MRYFNDEKTDFYLNVHWFPRLQNWKCLNLYWKHSISIDNNVNEESILDGAPNNYIR